MTTHGRRIDVDGLAYRLLETPAPAGSTALPVVLVHGIGMSHRYASRVHDALSAGGAVISVDLPGFGGLPKPGRDVDVSDVAAGLAEVLASIGQGPYILVGHSMGAQWVVETAVLRPELAAMVVAIGPVTDDAHRTVFAQARALALDSLGEPPSVNAIVFTDYIRCGVPWYLTQVRHMLAYPTEDRARALRMPLLVMRGGDDPVAGREWCRRLADSAPVSRLVEVPGHHHVVQHSAPAAVASAIRFHASEYWRVGAPAEDRSPERA